MTGEAPNGRINFHTDDGALAGRRVEVLADGVSIHIEQMDKGRGWIIRVDQPNGPSLVGNLTSSLEIRASWEWEPK